MKWSPIATVAIAFATTLLFGNPEIARADAGDGAQEAKAANQNLAEAAQDLKTQHYKDAKEKTRACIKTLDTAFKAHPDLKTRKLDAEGSTAMTVRDACAQVLDAAVKASSGGAPGPAADMEDGKAAVAGYNAALKAMNDKNIDAEGLIAGQQGADACRHGEGNLHSLRNNHDYPVWDEDDEKLPTAAGEITLKQLDNDCMKFQNELKERKANGCGTKVVSVQQDLLAHNTWGPLETYGGTLYEVHACKEMPKASKFPGASQSFAGKMKHLCGRGAVFIMADSSWVTSDNGGKPFRSMSGVCWETGKLNFGTGGAAVKY